jgi:hypothetical protein
MSGIPGLGAIGKDISEIATGIGDLSSGNIAGGIGDITKGVQGLEKLDKHDKHHDHGNNQFQQLLTELEQSFGIG